MTDIYHKHFELLIFLMGSVSLPRLTFALLTDGIGVRPLIEGALFYDPQEGDASTGVALILSLDAPIQTSDLNTRLKALLKTIDLPYFGHILLPTNKIPWSSSRGNLPAIQMQAANSPQVGQGETNVWSVLKD